MSGSTTSSEASQVGGSGAANLKELALLFGRLGLIGFGGPAAHIAMMEDEVVKRRKWISHKYFLDLLGVTNLIPGPNSTEMAIHVGLVKAGWRGLIVAGFCFIGPAVAITFGFAYLYVRFGSLPQLVPFIAGIRPAVIAVILGAVYRLGKPLVKKDRSTAVIGFLVASLALVQVNEILLLFSGGLVALFWANRHRFKSTFGVFIAAILLSTSAFRITETASPVDSITLSGLGLFFLKIGSILYGSGYVLVAFLQGGLVEGRHWLTQTQLLDAIAVGQFTPGPVLSTATFIGYILRGIPGASVATVGIFLPSFVFVLLISPFISKLRNIPSVRTFLDGVNASALGLMFAVCVSLGGIALSSPVMWLIFLGAGAAILAWNLHPAWLVLGGAIVGWLAMIIRI